MTTTPANRRTGLTQTFIWANKHEVSVTVNLDTNLSTPCEVFIKGAREDTELGAYANDIGIMISLALQNGIALDAMAKTLGADAPDPSMGALACQSALELWQDAAEEKRAVAK